MECNAKIITIIVILNLVCGMRFNPLPQRNNYKKFLFLRQDIVLSMIYTFKKL